mgnify:CR=1 FL=1
MKLKSGLEQAIELLGAQRVADACGLSYQAVWRWIQRGRLPRTEYTGETDYAGKIAAACREKDPASQVTRESLLGGRISQEAAA